MQAPAHTQVLFLSLIILSVLPHFVQLARICVFSAVGFMNYRSGYDTLLESLIDKGHEVTLFSTLPLNVNQEYQAKVHHINPKAVVSHLELFFSHVSPLEWRRKGKQHVLWDMLPILTLDICHIILQNEETQQWLRDEKQYDLFIVDSAWNECGIGLAHAFRAKLILFSFHSNLLTWNLDAFGAPSEVSWIPDSQYKADFPMSYFQKLHFVFRTLRWYIYRNSFTFYQIRKFCRKFLKVEGDFPSIRELEQNASLFLVNSHFSEEYARSLPPLFVPVGGVHIRSEGKPGALVKKVDKFLGNDSLGFILVNIGCTKDTVINLPYESVLAIQSAMQNAGEIVKFVMVWDGQLNASLPHSFSVMQNVLVLEECSPKLSNLLAHPQIKALISHGDTLDVQEAIYHGVPLILLPVAFEQDANAERTERLGRGIRVEILSLEEESLVDAVHDIIFNQTYKSNMKAASVTFRDRQNKPLESALWWIDYTLRNSDSSFLKPLGIHQSWFSRRSLDVWLLLFLCIFSASVVVIVVLIANLFKSHLHELLLISCNYCNYKGVGANPSRIQSGVKANAKEKKID